MDGKPGWKYGESGECYTYTEGDEKSSNAAKQKAQIQGAAMGMSELTDLLFDQDTIDIKGIEILNKFPNTHGIEFKDSDFAEIEKNFNQYLPEFRPHLKISHTDQQLILKELLKSENIEYGEELPALGFVDRVYPQGGKLLADVKGIPKKLSEFIFKKFRSISPEILTNFRNTGENVLRALVLLNNPSQKHIMDVHLSEGRAPVFDGLINLIKFEEEKTMDEDSYVNKITGVLSKFFGKGQTDRGGYVVSLSEFEDINKRLDDSLARIQKLSETVGVRDKQFTQQTAVLEKLAEKSRLGMADAICQAAINDGVPPAVVNPFRKILSDNVSEHVIRFQEKEKEGEKIIEQEITVAGIVKDFFAAYPNKINLGEKSKTTLSAKSEDKEKEMRVRKLELMEKEHMTEYEALKKIAGEFPEEV
jgi:hypothetical protein